MKRYSSSKLVTINRMPDDVKYVIEGTLEILEQHKGRLVVDDWDFAMEYYHIGEHFMEDNLENAWVLGSNFEDGNSSCIYNIDENKWYYRNPWSGEDRPIPDGKEEAKWQLATMLTG